LWVLAPRGPLVDLDHLVLTGLLVLLVVVGPTAPALVALLGAAALADGDHGQVDDATRSTRSLHHDVGYAPVGVLEAGEAQAVQRVVVFERQHELDWPILAPALEDGCGGVDRHAQIGRSEALDPVRPIEGLRSDEVVDQGDHCPTTGPSSAGELDEAKRNGRANRARSSFATSPSTCGASRGTGVYDRRLTANPVPIPGTVAALRCHPRYRRRPGRLDHGNPGLGGHGRRDQQEAEVHGRV
jgi:hypothetical protein